MKEMLSEIEDEGIVEKRERKIQSKGQMKQVEVIDIKGRDEDGGMIERKDEWDEERKGKKKVVMMRRKRIKKK